MTVSNTLVFIPNITKALRAAKRVLKLIDISEMNITINERETDPEVRNCSFVSERVIYLLLFLDQRQRLFFRR